MNERHRVSSFDCDHQPQGSQPEQRNIDIAKERNELLQIELDNEHLRDEIDKLRENRDKLEGNMGTKVKSLLNDVEDFRRYLGECRNTVRSQHDIINKLIAEKKADYDRWNRMAAHLELLKVSIDEKNRQIDELKNKVRQLQNEVNDVPKFNRIVRVDPPNRKQVVSRELDNVRMLITFGEVALDMNPDDADTRNVMHHLHEREKSLRTELEELNKKEE